MGVMRIQGVQYSGQWGGGSCPQDGETKRGARKHQIVLPESDLFGIGQGETNHMTSDATSTGKKREGGASS